MIYGSENRKKWGKEEGRKEEIICEKRRKNCVRLEEKAREKQEVMLRSYTENWLNLFMNFI